MANPGVGLRTAADVLMEISLHLIENVVNTLATQFAQGGYSDGGYSEGGYSDPIGSLIFVESQTAMYVGAMIVVGWGLSTAEVATITEINTDGTILTSTLVNSHNPGETILAPTFPTQQPTDPFYSQSEALGYLARAQNETLAATQVHYELVQQNLQFGQVTQATPDNCITLSRIAASQYFAVIATITRTDDSVLLVTVDPHGLQVGSTIFVQNATAGFGGVFEVASVPTPSSITYVQIADDGATTGGSILYFSRLYETTSTELTMANRNWRNTFLTVPTSYYEDRTGLYRWGVNGKPSSNFPVQLLMGIRDTDTLGLLDGFLFPDMLVYLIKYKTLAYMLLKDGVQQDPTRAAYCEERWKRGVAAIDRFLDGYTMGMKEGK